MIAPPLPTAQTSSAAVPCTSLNSTVAPVVTSTNCAPLQRRNFDPTNQTSEASLPQTASRSTRSVGSSSMLHTAPSHLMTKSRS